MILQVIFKYVQPVLIPVIKALQPFKQAVFSNNKAGRSLCDPGHSANTELLGHATGLLAYAAKEANK